MPIFKRFIHTTNKSVASVCLFILLTFSSYSFAELSIVPQVITGGSGFTSVVMSNGQVMAWGRNDNFQLGRGLITDGVNPAVVIDYNNNPITDIQAISAKAYHTLGLKRDGTLLIWGGLFVFELDYIPYKYATVVVDATNEPITSIQAISAGQQFSLLLKFDGTMLAWGTNSAGRLGDGTQTDRRNPVVVVDGDNNPITSIQAIAAGTSHSLALKADGTLLAWGANHVGQLGDGTTISRSNPVVVVDSNNNPITGIQAISAGSNYSLALKSDGTLLAWGYNSTGQLGDTTTVNRSNPVTTSTGIQAISAGHSHTLALKSDGTLLAWGSNVLGLLGDGTTDIFKSTPTIVLDSNSNPISNIRFITAAGDDHSAVLMSDDTLSAWGDNSYGGLGDGTKLTRRNPAAVVDANNDPFTIISSAVAHDFDLDGQADIFWRHSVSNENKIYLINGNLPKTDSSISIFDGDPDWKVVGYGDFDDDQKADILWRNSSTGANHISLMNGTSAPTGVALTISALTDSAWKAQGVGDFDGDDNVDIFWHHDNGENRITFMNGTTPTTTVSVNTITDPSWKVMGITDFDSDGQDDVLWRHETNRRVWLYLMDGSTIDNGSGTGEHVAFTSENWNIEEVGDFDADGSGDILWRHNTNGRVWMYLMNGTTIANGTVNAPGEHVAFTSLDWDIEAIGDYDGDGKQDIFWRNNIDGRNHIYHMNGASLEQSGGVSVNTLSDLNWNVENQ